MQQPAKVSYFFGKGYRDLWAVIRELWKRNLDGVQRHFAYVKENGALTAAGGMHLAAGISILTFGSIISAVTTLVHVAVLLVFFLLIYVGFVLLWTIDRCYIFIRRIRNVCPEPSCQAAFLLPVYLCPDCGRQHTRLVPDRYGIVRRRCLCGRKLPTTFLGGRGRLDACCPVCGCALTGDTGSRQHVFPVIGGPSAGKTCYIHMAAEQLIQHGTPDGRMLSFMDEAQEQAHQRVVQGFAEGRCPAKTELAALTAVQLMLRRRGAHVGRRVNLYDISGERFSRSSDVQANDAYRYADGFVFLLDPLTLPAFAAELEGHIDPARYGAGSKDSDEVLSLMLLNLGKMCGLRDSDVMDRSLAVIISKADIPALDRYVGDNAAGAYRSDHPETDPALAADAVCRGFLIHYGAGNFVRTAQARFRHVRFFSCSALGHAADGTAFRPVRVTEPLLWLLGSGS